MVGGFEVAKGLINSVFNSIFLWGRLFIPPKGMGNSLLGRIEGRKDTETDLSDPIGEISLFLSCLLITDHVEYKYMHNLLKTRTHIQLAS